MVLGDHVRFVRPRSLVHGPGHLQMQPPSSDLGKQSTLALGMPSVQPNTVRRRRCQRRIRSLDLALTNPATTRDHDESRQKVAGYTNLQCWSIVRYMTHHS